MTPAEQRIITELNKTGGNVAEVARTLGTSDSYIYRIKRELWKPGDETLERSMVPVETATSLTAVLPPDVPAMRHLRDQTIRVLNKALSSLEGADGILIDLGEVNKLLKTILQYEGALRQQVTPALNIFQDNRQNIQINNLVDELGKLSPDTLRAFDGVPEPVIIDVGDIHGRNS